MYNGCSSRNKGFGQSSDSPYPSAYHHALHRAGIMSQNIVTYSSILPANAKLIEKPELIYGAKMECIMAVHQGIKDETLSAGICYNWLYDKGKKIGGIVVERHGHFDVGALKERLIDSIWELKNETLQQYTWDEEGFKFIMECQKPDKEFGCVIVALCFTSYLQL